MSLGSTEFLVKVLLVKVEVLKKVNRAFSPNFFKENFLTLI